MNVLTPQQALINLYGAARQLKDTADVHDVIGKSFQILKEAITPPKVEEVIVNSENS